MNSTIAALVCAPLLVTALAAQERDPRRTIRQGSGLKAPSTCPLEGLDEPSLRTSNGSESESATVQPSASRVRERLEGQPGDIVVAFLDEVEPGEYSLSDLPLRSAVYLGLVGSDGQFELRGGTGSTRHRNGCTGRPPARIERHAQTSGLPRSVSTRFLVDRSWCGCSGTPGLDNLGGGTSSFVSSVRFMGKGLFVGRQLHRCRRRHRQPRRPLERHHVERPPGWRHRLHRLSHPRRLQPRALQGPHVRRRPIPQCRRPPPAITSPSFEASTGWLEPNGWRSGWSQSLHRRLRHGALQRRRPGNDLYVAWRHPHSRRRLRLRHRPVGRHELERSQRRAPTPTSWSPLWARTTTAAATCWWPRVASAPSVGSPPTSSLSGTAPRGAPMGLRRVNDVVNAIVQFGNDPLRGTVPSPSPAARVGLPHRQVGRQQLVRRRRRKAPTATSLL